MDLGHGSSKVGEELLQASHVCVSVTAGVCERDVSVIYCEVATDNHLSPVYCLKKMVIVFDVPTSLHCYAAIN